MMLRARVAEGIRLIRPAFPYIHALLQLLTRTRFVLFVFVALLWMLLLQTIKDSAGDIQRFYCFGPAVPPIEVDAHQNSIWHAHQNTPVLFNHHEPIVVDSPSIVGVDLNNIKASRNAKDNKEIVLILTPLREATSYLQKHFDLILDLTYPHELIDLAFLVGDSQDETLAMLATEVGRVQRGKRAFRSVQIIKKSFGSVLKDPNNVAERHSLAAQGPRRKAMGRARNYLLYSALKPDHSWVFWRDVDVVESPATILEDFMDHDKDVVVPNIWFHRYENGKDIEGRFDYNSWQETDESRKLTATLDKDFILAEGYKEIVTNRNYMALMGNRNEDPKWEIDLDGIGGVSVLVKAEVHRSGINFPCYSFENQAETEGFAKMAKRAGYSVVGLPNYVVWHIDTEEPFGNAA